MEIIRFFQVHLETPIPYRCVGRRTANVLHIQSHQSSFTAPPTLSIPFFYIFLLESLHLFHFPGTGSQLRIPITVGAMQQDALGKSRNQSMALSSTPVPLHEKRAGGSARRVTRSATRALSGQAATPAIKPVPVKSSRPTQPGNASTATTPPKRSSKRKTQEASRAEVRDSTCVRPEDVARDVNVNGASPPKRARRDDIVEYHGPERRPRPWRDCPLDSYAARVDRINLTRYVTISSSPHFDDD